MKKKPYIVVTSAYTPDMYYIGSPEDAEYLMVKMGILPELVHKTDSVCSIGFCKRQRKWYGWSHRAIYGFGVGSKRKKGDVAYAEHGCMTARTLADAKKMAIQFADDVS